MKLEFEIVKDNRTYYTHWYDDCLETAFETVIKWYFGSEALDNVKYNKDMSDACLDGGFVCFLGSNEPFDILNMNNLLKPFKNKSITWGEFKGLN